MSTHEKKQEQEPETPASRRRALIANRIMVLTVGGLLLYMLLQRLREDEPMPIGFILATVALFAVLALIFLVNVKAVKAVDIELKEIAAKAEHEQPVIDVEDEKDNSDYLE